jgi:hypothetical protein
MLQLGQLFGAVPPKYVPEMQVLQSFNPDPMQVAQGDTQAGQVLSEDFQY